MLLLHQQPLQGISDEKKFSSLFKSSQKIALDVKYGNEGGLEVKVVNYLPSDTYNAAVTNLGRAKKSLNFPRKHLKSEVMPLPFIQELL